jgi:hypothetical protein
MSEKRLSIENAQCILMISAIDHLHFDNHATRLIKSGSKCNFRCLGGTYKLLSAHPYPRFAGVQAPLRSLNTSPSSVGEGFSIYSIFCCLKNCISPFDESRWADVPWK